MSKIKTELTFKYRDEDGDITMRLTEEGQSISEVVENFKRFLLCIGYAQKNIADYFHGEAE